MTTWNVEGRRLTVRFSLSHIDELAALVLSGYKRSPWGGVEVGGVLFGKQQPGGFQILQHRVLESEHVYGPSFELSDRDLERLASLLGSPETDPKLKGLVPVGWYYSISQRDLSLTPASGAVIDRFFPEPWQVTLVLKRSSKEPVLLGFFFREDNGSIQTRTPHRFSLDELRALPSGVELPSEVHLPSEVDEDGAAIVGDPLDVQPESKPLAPVRVLKPQLPSLASALAESQKFKTPEPPPVAEPEFIADSAAPEATVIHSQPFLVPDMPAPSAASPAHESEHLEAPEPPIVKTPEPPPLPEPASPSFAPPVVAPESSEEPESLPVTEPESPVFLTEPQTAVVEPPALLPEPVVLHFDPVVEEQERFTTPEPSSTADPELPAIASAPEESSDVPEPGLELKLDPKLNPGLEPELEPEPLPIMEPALPSFASASNEPEEIETSEPAEPPAVPEPELPRQASAADESEVIDVPEPTPVWEPDESSLEAEPQNFVTYFKLDQDPFLLTPDTSFFYPSPEHNEAIANLSYGIQGRRGFLALTGESGSGKTMVLECVMLKLERQRVDFAYLSHSNITTDEFFGLLNYDLDLRCPSPTKVKVLVALNERLIENLRDGRITVLFVDNAHKLSVDVIEEIELIGNMETRRSKLIQVVFSGQPDFDEVLDHPRLRGLRQRILARCRIEPLTARHTAEYIEARLSRAGLANQKVFSEDVLAAIHQSTGGRPRFINAVCGALLEACMERRTRTADLGLLEYVTSEMELDRPFG